MSSSFALEKTSEIAGRLKPTSLINKASSSFSDNKHFISTTETESNINVLQSSLDLVRLDDDLQYHRIKLVSIQQLLQALNSLIVSSLASPTTHDGPSDQVQSTLLIQIILRSYSNLFHSLCLQSNWLKDQIDFWFKIETDRISAISYLIQTIPARSIGLAHRIWNHSIQPKQHVKLLSDQSNSSSLGLTNKSYSNVSILNLFPILSTNLMTQSSAIIGLRNHWSNQVLRLTRQEVRLKRKALQAVHLDLVERIGHLVNCLNFLEQKIDIPTESDDALFGLVGEMIQLTSPLDPKTEKRLVLIKPEGFIDQLHELLSIHLKNLDEDLQIGVSSFSAPGLLTRNWPWLVSFPMISYAISTLAMKYKTKILVGLRDAQETLKGFISGWLIRPIEDIIQTLKAGQKGTLAIMTKDSLPSELDSLERMVVDFGRDKFKWTDDQLAELSESVKAGNLTSVLKVWEQEIKAPIRSAIVGSLIRVLLIQIQKVKVDLSLAMDGIQSILRSQSLTFGAIGVAPSMLICFMFGKLFNSLIKQRISVVGKGTKAVRKEVRIAMRRIERTLLLITSSPGDDSNHPITKSHIKNPERTIGFLFLDLHLMRYFAHSPHFPSRESSQSVRLEFISDIKDLESFHLSWKTKSKLAKRFISRWGFLVGI